MRKEGGVFERKNRRKGESGESEQTPDGNREGTFGQTEREEEKDG